MLRLPTVHGGALAIRHVAGNIGGEILSRFVVTFDHARKRVHLAADAASSRPYDADRAGLWINRHARGAVVGTVMAGEPAGPIGLDALRRRLAEWPAGRRVAVEVARGDATTRVELVLRDLVAGAQRAE